MTVALAGAAIVATAALAWAGGVGAAGPDLATVGRSGSVGAASFVRHVTNPFFPLPPGTLLVYRGQKDGESQTDRVFVTSKTKIVLGVRTTVVRDIARHNGSLLEKTFDWYAQDRQGNVWYFGENTKEFEPNGNVSTEGSWHAGVDGARAGIVMEADPRIADGYRQEFWKGHAEDQAWVLTRGGHVTVPFGRIAHALLTMEWTPLEPNVIDQKVYGRGIGIVREITKAGPLETSELVAIRQPGA